MKIALFLLFAAFVHRYEASAPGQEAFEFFSRTSRSMKAMQSGRRLDDVSNINIECVKPMLKIAEFHKECPGDMAFFDSGIMGANASTMAKYCKGNKPSGCLKKYINVQTNVFKHLSDAGCHDEDPDPGEVLMGINSIAFRCVQSKSGKYCHSEMDNYYLGTTRGDCAILEELGCCYGSIRKFQSSECLGIVPESATVPDPAANCPKLENGTCKGMGRVCNAGSSIVLAGLAITSVIFGTIALM